MGEDWDAVVPVVAGRPQPLHALYHRRCLPAVEAALQTGERRMDSFYPQVRIRFVTEDEVRPIDSELRSFVNVNTPEEWDALVGRTDSPTYGTSRQSEPFLCLL